MSNFEGHNFEKMKFEEPIIKEPNSKNQELEESQFEETNSDDSIEFEDGLKIDSINENEINSDDEFNHVTKPKNEIDIHQFLLGDNIYRLISQGLSDFDTNEELPDHIMVSDVSMKTSLRSKIHYCFYCDQGQNHIWQHLKHMHKAESEVIDALNESSSANKDLKLALIKNKGDHIHNLGVLRNKRGYLVVARAPDGMISYPENFLPCVFCKSWVAKDSVKRHRCNYIEIVVDKKNLMTNLSHTKLSKMVFKKEMEKIEGKPQSSEEKKIELCGNQRFR